MITYELAKQLKDAGFKIHPGMMQGKLVQRPEPENHMYFPTLSELIEACSEMGNTFLELKHIVDSPASELNGLWQATGFNNKKDSYEKVTATIPETAVAKLWLALKK
jgi:hypothetical protein